MHKGIANMNEMCYNCDGDNRCFGKKLHCDKSFTRII